MGQMNPRGPDRLFADSLTPVRTSRSSAGLRLFGPWCRSVGIVAICSSTQSNSSADRDPAASNGALDRRFGVNSATECRSQNRQTDDCCSRYGFASGCPYASLGERRRRSLSSKRTVSPAGFCFGASHGASAKRLSRRLFQAMALKVQRQDWSPLPPLPAALSLSARRASKNRARTAAAM
jgi:hypothetical protein